MILHSLNDFLHAQRKCKSLTEFVIEMMYWHYPIKTQHPWDITVHSLLVWKSRWLQWLLSFVCSIILGPTTVPWNLVFQYEIFTDFCLETCFCHGSSDRAMQFFKTCLPPKRNGLCLCKNALCSFCPAERTHCLVECILLIPCPRHIEIEIETPWEQQEQDR